MDGKEAARSAQATKTAGPVGLEAARSAQIACQEAARLAEPAQPADETEEDVCQQRVKTSKKYLTLKGVLNPNIKEGDEFIAALIIGFYTST